MIRQEYTTTTYKFINENLNITSGNKSLKCTGEYKDDIESMFKLYDVSVVVFLLESEYEKYNIEDKTIHNNNEITNLIEQVHLRHGGNTYQADYYNKRTFYYRFNNYKEFERFRYYLNKSEFPYLVYVFEDKFEDEMNYMFKKLIKTIQECQ